MKNLLREAIDILQLNHGNSISRQQIDFRLILVFGKDNDFLCRNPCGIRQAECHQKHHQQRERVCTIDTGHFALQR